MNEFNNNLHPERPLTPTGEGPCLWIAINGALLFFKKSPLKSTADELLSQQKEIAEILANRGLGNKDSRYGAAGLYLIIRELTAQGISLKEFICSKETYKGIIECSSLLSELKNVKYKAVVEGRKVNFRYPALFFISPPQENNEASQHAWFCADNKKFTEGKNFHIMPRYVISGLIQFQHKQ